MIVIILLLYISNYHRKKAVRTDFLTQMPNRKKLIEDMNQVINLSFPYGIIMMDVDHFKDINDIGNVSTKAEHEVMPSETRKYRITKVGTENYGGDENPDWLGGGYSGGVNVVVVDIEPSDQRTDGGPGS